MKWLRRLAFTLAGLGALLLLARFGAFQSDGGRPADVVVLSLDTTRADHLGVYGHPHPVSPHLDALAREAIVYDRAWSTAPWTLPAHASMFTGRHPKSHGAHFDLEHGTLHVAGRLARRRGLSFRVNPLPDDAVTLAEVGAARGYATGAFVGGPWLAPEFGLLQGFERIGFDATDHTGTRAPALTNAAIAWLDSLPEAKPALLFVNYFDPHSPYDPPQRFRSLARGNGPDRGDPQSRRGPEVLERYDGEIRFMDHHIGRLLDALRRLDRYDDALIVVVGDHGELFGEHGKLGHRNWLYEELIRVPLIVRHPKGRRGGTRSDALVSVVDLPTWIAGITGLPEPEGAEGLAEGERELVLAESHRDALGIDDDPALDRDLFAAIRWPWKLIVSSRGERQLFRLDDDPGEQRDRPLAAVADGLHVALDAARAAMDPLPRRPASAEISDDAARQLRALGYLETE